MHFGNHNPDHKDRGVAGDQWRINFPNGYGASIIRGPYSYGGDDGLFELAVFKGGHLTYETPITNAVLGYLTKSDVADLLDKIQALSAAGGAS
jgi:hypothetical protein